MFSRLDGRTKSCNFNTEAKKKHPPLNEGAKEQSDGLLYILSAQPTPLVLHQQTQDIQSYVCHSCVCR